jgi:acetolactate synthase small subunit
MNERSQQDAKNLEQVAATWENIQDVYKHLSLALSAAIPIRMLRLIKRSGPEDEDFERVHMYVQDFVERGTDLFFSGSSEGVKADRFEQVVDAIAVLAFCPGGLTIFGEHYQGPERQEEKL